MYHFIKQRMAKKETCTFSDLTASAIYLDWTSQNKIIQLIGNDL